MRLFSASQAANFEDWTSRFRDYTAAESLQKAEDKANDLKVEYKNGTLVQIVNIYTQGVVVYCETNEYLRGWNSNPDNLWSDYTVMLRDAINTLCPLEQGGCVHSVYRGTCTKDDLNQTTEHVTSRAFTSTTLNPTVALKEFAERYGTNSLFVELRNVKALRVSKFSDNLI